jgi:PEP-CTERM motif
MSLKSGVIMMVALSAILAGPSLSYAAVLYSQNFEAPVTTASTTVGPGGFVQLNNLGGSGWQVQGGGGNGGVTLTAGVDINGVGGSQALFANWDQTPAAGSFSFNQYTVYGGVAAPGAGTPLANIQVSMDLFMSGSESSNTPIDILIQNGGDNKFTPTLTNGAYTHVVFTLAQTTGGAYDPTQLSNVRLQHGAGGFGFDANNIVRVDNILVQTVPEPSALLLMGFGSLAVAALRRK